MVPFGKPVDSLTIRSVWMLYSRLCVFLGLLDMGAQRRYCGAGEGYRYSANQDNVYLFCRDLRWAPHLAQSCDRCAA
jgi:hypothetical protein